MSTVRGVLVAVLLLGGGCTRASPWATQGPDGAAGRVLLVRVPAALRIARSLDTLSVAIDPAALAPLEVHPDEGMVLGVEAETFVSARGQPRPDHGKKVVAAGSDFGLVAGTWSSGQEGIPAPETRYVVEMTLVLFEMEAPAARGWNPEASRHKVLWTRTLRQSEE